MRVILLTTGLVLSLICMGFTIDSLNIIFWVSMLSFVLICAYIEENKEQLLREIDDLFDENI